MFGIYKLEFYLIAVFIVFLIIVIVSGRILNKINDSSCKSNSDIKVAHRWAAWAVGISATAAGLSLLGALGIIFIG